MLLALLYTFIKNSFLDHSAFRCYNVKEVVFVSNTGSVSSMTPPLQQYTKLESSSTELGSDDVFKSISTSVTSSSTSSVMSKNKTSEIKESPVLDKNEKGK